MEWLFAQILEAGGLDAGILSAPKSSAWQHSKLDPPEKGTGSCVHRYAACPCALSFKFPDIASCFFRRLTLITLLALRDGYCSWEQLLIKHEVDALRECVAGEVVADGQ
jgi:hypothetical protein